MRNPAVTREQILKTSGDLFNTLGYKATSLSAITEATGYTKGAIYRHFVNKEELETATFSYLSDRVVQALGQKIRSAANAREKLGVIFDFFRSYLENPPVQGGCPLLNVAIESDDAHPVLRKQARIMLKLLREAVITILENGKRYNQIKKDTDSACHAAVIIATLEGAIMKSKLEQDSSDMHYILRHLSQVVEQISE